MAAEDSRSTACTGSSLLQPVSEITNLPLDQVNFVVCQLCALLSAFWFRLFLHPSKTSPFIRHMVATLLGLYFALFCFGWYALHFLVQSGLTYGIMILTGVEHMHKSRVQMSQLSEEAEEEESLSESGDEEEPSAAT